MVILLQERGGINLTEFCTNTKLQCTAVAASKGLENGHLHFLTEVNESENLLLQFCPDIIKIKKMRKLNSGLSGIVSMSSYSVQQFQVSTKAEPFQNKSRVCGARVEKCGENGWKLDFKKDKDMYVQGIHVRSIDVKTMVKELEASRYMIATKSNPLLSFVTFGIVDDKIVKVIKRDN